MSEISAPRTAERLLEALGAGGDFCDSVLGDLAEEFENRRESDGPRAARRCYRESVRVAPYLLHDWLRNLRWRQLGYFSSVVLFSSVCAIVLDVSLRLGVNGVLLLTKGTDLGGIPPTALFAGLMLLWTAVDGSFAGYVAARIGRKAPLPSTLLVAAVWIGLMLRSGWGVVPSWFLALNVTTMVAGTLAGGTIRVLRSARAG